MRLFAAPSQVSGGNGPSYAEVGGTVPAGTRRVEVRYPGAATVQATVGSGLFVAVVPSDEASRAGTAFALGSDGRTLASVTVPPA
jgi:hypothetical protein